MHIISFNEYKRIVKMSLLDDLTTGFKKNFIRFKKNHRKKYQTIK